MSPLKSLEPTPETIEVDLHISDSVDCILPFYEIKIKTLDEIIIWLISNSYMWYLRIHLVLLKNN